jgi:nucleotide-binding universal stress UspA family protein
MQNPEVGLSFAHACTQISEKLMYSQILVPVDGSTASISGLHEAIKIAKGQGSKLRLLHIVKAPLLDYGFTAGYSRKDAIATLTECGKIILSKAETIARQEGLAPECVMFESVVGPAADVIIDQAKRWPANLIVMGSHASGGPGRVGSDSAEVLAHAQVPVLFVRAADSAPESSEYRPMDYAFVA